jgi:hypothetical protein
MNVEETKFYIDYLYKKYKVDDSFYSSMSEREFIIGIKGILAELDSKKIIQYDKNDIDIIKDIYSSWC